MKSETRKLSTLGRDKRGAVLAEFILAIWPVLMAFFCFLQLARIAQARLVLKHAAIVSARAAAVMSAANNNNPGETGDGTGQIINATTDALGEWWLKPGGFVVVSLYVIDNSSESDPYGWVTVEVTGEYDCVVPLGKLICSGGKSMTERYRMPHQGANYKL